MQRSHYALQALLYTVALHRYLRWRLTGYDPAEHLGGVLYLFVRGMVGETRRRRVRVAPARAARRGAQRPVRGGDGVTDVELDRFDVRRARSTAPELVPFNEAGVLAAADVHVAQRLGELAGADDALLAAALAVRAPRLGHVYVDLATVSQTVTVEAEEPVDLGALPWPEPDAWVAAIAEQPARRRRRGRDRDPPAAGSSAAASTSTATGARSARSPRTSPR